MRTNELRPIQFYLIRTNSFIARKFLSFPDIIVQHSPCKLTPKSEPVAVSFPLINLTYNLEMIHDYDPKSNYAKAPSLQTMLPDGRTVGTEPIKTIYPSEMPYSRKVPLAPLLLPAFRVTFWRWRSTSSRRQFRSLFYITITYIPHKLFFFLSHQNFLKKIIAHR